MPRIKPVSSVPLVRPDDAALTSTSPPSVLDVPPAEFLWVECKLTSGSVGLRPYYFAEEPESASPLKGAWIPLGGDAVLGSQAMQASAAAHGGASNARYAGRRAGRAFVLVEEGAIAPAYDFVHVDAELSVASQ